MPIDRGSIDAQLRAIGEGERWWELREFRDLPYILYPEEQIRGLVTGKLLGGRRPRVLPLATWLLVATDQRLLGLRQERFGRKQIEIARGQVTRVRERNRLRSYQITLETTTRKYRMRISKSESIRFRQALAPLTADLPVQPLHPDLEALSWVPGIRTVAGLPGVSGLISKVSLVSAQGYPARVDTARLEDAIDRLQGDVEKLQQQVAFLEDLLHKRAGEVMLPESANSTSEGDW